MKTLLVSINDATMIDEIKIAIEQIPGVVSVIKDTSYDNKRISYVRKSRRKTFVFLLL